MCINVFFAFPLFFASFIVCAFLFIAPFGSWCKIVAYFLLLFAVIGGGWLIYASISPLEVAEEEFFDIEMVTFPNGSRQQMASCHGEQFSVTKRFGYIVPSGWQLKRTSYNEVYAWISYPVRPSYRLIPPSPYDEKCPFTKEKK